MDARKNGSSDLDDAARLAMNGRLERPLDVNALVSSHIERFARTVKGLDIESIERVVQLLRAARDRGSTVFIAGNGGSAAIASHFVNDLGKATKSSGRRHMRVMSLADNASWTTALANDEGYDRVFAGQLENFAEPHDVLVAVSSSGGSTNLIDAVELARERDVRTVALVGFDGGELRDLADEVVWVPTELGAYELAEDAHALICHLITICLVNDRTDSGRPDRAVHATSAV